MNSIFLLTLLFVTVNCGLLDGLGENKKASDNPDLLKKIVTDLKDDGKIIVDTLTGAIKKNKDKKENTPEESKPEDAKVTETTPSTEDLKGKAEDEVKGTTPKVPEATSVKQPEPSTVKTEAAASDKTEADITPKTEDKETPTTPKAK